jgi:hypothetical protein
MKSEIPEKFCAKINEFMIERDVRLAPGFIICPCFIEGSWCEVWTVFTDKSAAMNISEEDENQETDEITVKLQSEGLEYTVRQVNIVDQFTPLRCQVGDHFFATSDAETIDFLKGISHPVAAKKASGNTSVQTQA